MTQVTLDEAKMQDFAGRFLQAVNGLSVITLAGIGRQTGLFEVLAKLPPSTSTDIAAAGSLDERYVREWLGGMVLARVVEYDAVTQRYSLPPEHAAFLTKASGPNDLTTFTTFVPYVGAIWDRVAESFSNGGGVAYGELPDFQALQAAMTEPFLDANLIDMVLPLAPGVTDVLQAGGTALDIGCGAGHAVTLLARAFPSSTFTGYDFAADGIEMARAEATASGLANARFDVKDIATVSEPDRYDLITAIEVVHDLARPVEVLRGAYNALKPGGMLLVIDIQASSVLEENYEHPIGPAFFMFSIFHCMTVSLAQGGAGLGTMVGEQKVTSLLNEAGFTDVEIKHLDGDFFYSYYIARK